MPNVVELIGKEKLAEELNVTLEQLESLMENHAPIPKTEMDISFTETLTYYAVINAVKRHAGTLRNIYGPSGKKTVAEGKDLTGVKYIIGTGGALTRLPNRISIMEKIPLSNKGNELLPTKEARILVDNYYIMASLGVMSKKYPEAALRLLKESLDI